MAIQIENSNKINPLVVVSGAGPEGLACALEVIKNGNRVRILEKGPALSERGPQSVLLKTEMVAFLKAYGIYQELLSKKMIYHEKEGRFVVRLVDLEKTMREKVESQGVKIEYNSSIQKIFKSRVSDKAALCLQNGEEIRSVDVLINAEGYHSRINHLLHNDRVEVYDKQPILVSILKDDRPTIEDLKSLIIYSSKTAQNVALSIYYHVIYVFRALFYHEHRSITSASTLRTPGQHHVNFGFSKELSEEISCLSQAVENGEISKEELDRFVEYWTHIALAEENCFAVIAYVSRFFGIKNRTFVSAPYYPLTSYTVSYIHSDYVKKPSIKIGATAVLMTGDALATTGLASIQQEEAVSELLVSLKSNVPLKVALHWYDDVSRKTIQKIQDKAFKFRKLYRPDTILGLPDPGIKAHRRHIRAIIKYPHLLEREGEVRKMAEIFEKTLTPVEKHIFATIEHLCDDHKLIIKLFQGANFQLEDEGHFYERWHSLQGVKSRSSSHNHRRGEARSFSSPFYKELLFWKDKDTGHTHLQLENHPARITAPIHTLLHFKDYIEYKRTKHQIGPFGKSPHTDKNPVCIARDSCKATRSLIESLS